jgi:hypothetical protein
MKFLRKIFGRSGNNNAQPAEPIFPGESFAIFKLNFPDGWGLGTFNKKYEHYPNKSFYPWLVLIELEIVDKNDNGHPTDTEGEKLAELEESITEFIKQKHTTHFVGRVTRNGDRELLYYIDTPKFVQAEVNAFCDNIMQERGINWGMEKDPEWKGVSGFLE